MKTKVRQLAAICISGLLATSCSSSSGIGAPTEVATGPKTDLVERNKPHGGNSALSPFSISGSQVSREAFEASILSYLGQIDRSADLQTIAIGSFSLKEDGTWSFLGNSVVLSVRGDLCEPSDASIVVSRYENDFKELLEIAAGIKLPFRFSAASSVSMTMPSHYESETAALGRGPLLLSPAISHTRFAEMFEGKSETQEKSLEISGSSSELKVRLMLKLSGSEYLSLRLNYNETACP